MMNRDQLLLEIIKMADELFEKDSEHSAEYWGWSVEASRLLGRS